MGDFLFHKNEFLFSPISKIGGFGYGSKKIIINNRYLTSKFTIYEKTPDELGELTSEYYNFT